MKNYVTKEVAEQAIIERFISGYKNQLGLELIVVDHRDKPDFEVINQETKERLGVEITGLYQNDQEAKINYSLDVGWKWDHFEGAWDDIVARLNMRLADKATKSKEYHYPGRMLLAIFVGSLVYNEPRDYESIEKRLVIPDNLFSEIWLILRSNNGGETVLKALKT